MRVPGARRGVAHWRGEAVSELAGALGVLQVRISKIDTAISQASTSRAPGRRPPWQYRRSGPRDRIARLTWADMAPETSAQPEPSLLEIVRGNTRLGPVPLVPEIQIHQASEPIGLWEGTELATGWSGLDPPFWAFAWAGGRALARYLLDYPEVVRRRRSSTSHPDLAWWRSPQPRQAPRP